MNTTVASIRSVTPSAALVTTSAEGVIPAQSGNPEKIELDTRFRGCDRALGGRVNSFASQSGDFYRAEVQG